MLMTVAIDQSSDIQSFFSHTKYRAVLEVYVVELVIPILGIMVIFSVHF